MTALDLLTAIGGSKSLAALDGFCKAVWSDWGAGQLSDEQAQSLAETIEARRREVRGSDTVAARVPQVAAKAKSAGRPSHFPPKRRASRSPDRRASIERRRKLAASGPMPPQLACRFTTGELAALRIIADPVRDPRGLHDGLGRDRGAGRGLRHHGAERPTTSRARGDSSRSRSGGVTSGPIYPMSCGSCRANGRTGSSAAGG